MLHFFRRLRHHFFSAHNTGKYLLYALGEIILVVIGILIALQIDTWNENKKDRAAESAYLRELLEDVELNLQKSEKTGMLIERELPGIIGLLEQSALDKPTLSLDSLNSAFRLLNSMPAYVSTDRTYNNLIGSGEFRLITSSELKTALANYYKSLDLLRLVQATHEMELVQSFQPYIMERMDFQAVGLIRVDDYKLPPPVEPDRILAVLHDREFRNILTLKVSILADLLDLNRDIGEVNKKLYRLLATSNETR